LGAVHAAAIPHQKTVTPQPSGFGETLANPRKAGRLGTFLTGAAREGMRRIVRTPITTRILERFLRKWRARAREIGNW